MHKTICLSWSIFITSCLCFAGETDKIIPKRQLTAGRTLKYNTLPHEVDSFAEFFENGVFYGRLRANSFMWDWHEENTLRKNNAALGLGGSIMYKTAILKGFSATIDAYTSQNPWHEDRQDIPYLKAGKDMLSRYDVFRDDDYYMNVIAQLYAEYSYKKIHLRYGRQKFESLLTRSNDTKIIPNTFEGITASLGEIYGTSTKIAWLTSQKLRDHTEFHDVLTFGDERYNSEDATERLLSRWAGNDDSAMHRGLSYGNYTKAGRDTDHDLLVAEANNSSIKNTDLMLNATAVPDVLLTTTAEAHHSFEIGNFKIIPGVRGLMQFDDGGGDVGGASLTGLLSPYSDADIGNGGYSNPDSLDGWLVAARIDLKSNAPWKLRLGYSHIGDEADIVAPWRGFPTAGFTRAMGQYNWYANTDTWMLRGDYNFEKAGLINGLTAMFRIATENFDDNKIVPLTDRNVLQLDAIQKIRKFPGLEARIRIEFVNADRSASGANLSSNEYRFEPNYLF